MKPIGKYILIKKIEEEVETSSGLLLSSEEASNSLRYAKAKVIAVGTDVANIEAEKNIYFDKHAGYTMMINSESYTVIREGDVVVVL